MAVTTPSGTSCASRTGDVLARQRAEHEDPCDDARGSVVVATARNAVEVRTRRNERLRFVSLKRYAKVPCAIARDVETRC